MKRILLVEDEPFLIDIYTTKLKKEGFEVEVVEEGNKVLPKLRELKPDLLVLDIVLPYLDGWDIMRKIKESEDLKDLKVIFLSNLGQKDEVERGLELGAVRYLIKAHYTPAEIVEEIKKVLK